MGMRCILFFDGEVGNLGTVSVYVGYLKRYLEEDTCRNGILEGDDFGMILGWRSNFLGWGRAIGFLDGIGRLVAYDLCDWVRDAVAAVSFHDFFGFDVGENYAGSF